MVHPLCGCFGGTRGPHSPTPARPMTSSSFDDDATNGLRELARPSAASLRHRVPDGAAKIPVAVRPADVQLEKMHDDDNSSRYPSAILTPSAQGSKALHNSADPAVSVRALLTSSELFGVPQGSFALSTVSTRPGTDDWLGVAGVADGAVSSKSLSGLSAATARSIIPALTPGQLQAEVGELVYIGQGATGLVYCGSVNCGSQAGDAGGDGPASGPVTVAVKFMICNTPQQLWQRAKEALLSKLVSHPNLVRTLAMDVTLVTPNTYREWGDKRRQSCDALGASQNTACADTASMGPRTASMFAAASISGPKVSASQSEPRNALVAPGADRASEELPPRMHPDPPFASQPFGIGGRSVPQDTHSASASAQASGEGPQACSVIVPAHPQIERLRSPVSTCHPGSRQRPTHERTLSPMLAAGIDPLTFRNTELCPTNSISSEPHCQPEPNESPAGVSASSACGPGSTWGKAGISSCGEEGGLVAAVPALQLPLSAMGTGGAHKEAEVPGGCGGQGAAYPPGGCIRQQQQRQEERLFAPRTASIAEGNAGRALRSVATEASLPELPFMREASPAAAARPSGAVTATPFDMRSNPQSPHPQTVLHAWTTLPAAGGAPVGVLPPYGRLSAGTSSLPSPLLASRPFGSPSRDGSHHSSNGVRPSTPSNAGAVGMSNGDGGCRGSNGGGGGHSSEPVPFQDILYHLDALPGRFLAKVIMEYCDSGTLLQRINTGDYVAHPDKGPLAMLAAMRALLWCLQEVAAGMAHLHCLNIIHGDLKPGNVLLTSGGSSPLGYVCKVSDFGLATALEASEQTITHENWGTVVYMAPESCAGRCRKASDVYSFGVLLWQMCTGQRPYAGMQAGQVLLGVKTGTLKLHWPAWTNKSLVKVGQACLRFEPKERPGFKGIRSALAKISARLDQKIAVVEAAGLHDAGLMQLSNSSAARNLAGQTCGAAVQEEEPEEEEEEPAVVVERGDPQ